MNSKIVVETPCEHGEQNPHSYPGKRISDLPYCPGGGSRIIDPENLPAEVIEAAAMEWLSLRGVRWKHLHVKDFEDAKTALSAAFRKFESKGDPT